MKSKTAALMIALAMLLYGGLSALNQQAFDSGCAWVTAAETPVYTLGAENEICVTLPAGTSCRVDETVGDTWQSIEFMLGGRTYTGMVLADALRRR